MNNNVLVGIVAALALVVSGYSLYGGGVIGPEGQMGPTGPKGDQGASGDTSFGAVASDTLDGSEWTVNGFKEVRRTEPINQATSSVVCAIKSPAATSTLQFASINFTYYDFGTIEMDVSTSSTRFASTSPALIAGAPLAEPMNKPIIWTAGANASTTAYGILGSQSQSGGAITGESSNLLPPNSWLTFRIATTATTYLWPNAAKGQCKGQFFVL